MFKQFELFEKSSSGGRSATEMRVSLNTRGLFVLNRMAMDAMGNPAAVELYFDRQNALVGLKPSTADVKHAYTTQKQGKSTSYIVRGKAFCNHYNIQVSGTVSFDGIELEDGMLILDLNKTTEVAPRPVNKKKKFLREAFVVGGGK